MSPCSIRSVRNSLARAVDGPGTLHDRRRSLDDDHDDDDEREGEGESESEGEGSV